MKYLIKDFFSARIANESVNKEHFIKELNNKQITISKLLEKNPEFQEALMISSASLFKSIKDHKNFDKQEKALVRYFIRSFTRPTPYGLFAGISAGKFSEETNFEKSDSVFKYSTIDMEWIYKIIENVEQILLRTGKIRVKYNQQCIISGNSVINPYFCGMFENGGGIKNDVSTILVRYTKQVECVKKMASEWIGYKEIENKLMETNPEIEKRVIEKFLKDLIENQILITECKISINEKDWPYVKI